MNEVEALVEHMKLGTSEDDSYWSLFHCNKIVNDSIVNAYSLGFKRGFKACKNGLIGAAKEDLKSFWFNWRRFWETNQHRYIPDEPPIVVKEAFTSGRLSGVNEAESRIKDLEALIKECARYNCFSMLPNYGTTEQKKIIVSVVGEK